MGLTRENKFLLHDVDVSTGPPDRSIQHDLLRVVAAHTAHPIPAVFAQAGSEITTRHKDILKTAALDYSLDISNCNKQPSLCACLTLLKCTDWNKLCSGIVCLILHML